MTALATATQTPVDLPGLLSLAVLSVTCARHVAVRPWDGWVEPVNLYVLVVLPPANRKSSVFAAMVDVLLKYEADEARRLAPEIKAAESRHQILSQRLKKVEEAAARLEGEKQEIEKAKAEDLARELAGMTLPQRPRLITDDSSTERLIGVLQEQNGRMAVMSAEGGIFDVMAGRYSASGTPNIDAFLKGHSGDTVVVDRITRPGERIERPALTMGLEVQPEVLRGLKERPSFRGRGLLGRFCYGIPASTVGRRQIRPPGVPPQAQQGYDILVRKLLGLEPPLDSDGQAIPHVLHLTPEASYAVERFAEAVEPMLREGGEFGHISDWAGKLVGFVVRVAGLLHIALHIEHRDPRRLPVSRETVAGAIEIGAYAAEHAKAAFAEMGADPAVEDARHIWSWIERGGHASLTKRDIFEGTKGRFHRAHLLEAGLSVLVERGYLRPVDEGLRAGPGRKPSQRYEVNPLAPSRNSRNSQNARLTDDSADTANSASTASDQARQRLIADDEREVIEL